MTNKRILQLVLKKKWFDMIASGIKKEEYRDVKPFYKSRLVDGHSDFIDEETGDVVTYECFKDFDIVRFYLGYAKDRPSIDLECNGITFDYGKEEWGAAKGQKYYVIHLGRILNRKL